MRNFPFFILLLFLLYFNLLSDSKNFLLPEKYRKWLEEVVYIITPKEKEVFLQLQNDREREIFINAFWKARDPDPNTPENEFKDEHYRRIAYANHYFGRLSPTPGWKTDRGRIYIILGEPNQKEVYENLPDVYPVEIWFYQGLGKYGLPNAFYVVFFRRDDSSDYEIYSPVKDGPKSLLRFFEMYKGADPLDFEYAYRLLYQAKPEIASKAISLIPGEQSTTAPSLASEVLLSNISFAPIKRVKDEYAEKLLKYKEIIEVDYTANYIENSFVCKVIPENRESAYIHYLIEPKRFSVELVNGNYRTFLEIDGRLTDLKGKTIYQFNRKLSVSLTEKEVNELKLKPISIQGLVPVATGNYRLSIILKNVVSKEFTVIESDINYPSFPETLAMTPLLLGYHYKEDTEEKKRAFRVGNGRLFLSAIPNFSVSENLHILFSILGSEEELRKTSSVKFLLSDETGNVVKEKSLPLKISLKSSSVHETFELKDLKSGNYKIEVKIEDQEGRILLSEKKEFGVSAVPFIPRPLVYSEPSASPGDPIFYFTVGSQYFNKGENDKAIELFKKAYLMEPLNQKFAIGYARSLLFEKKYSDMKEVLLPFISSENKEPSVFELLGIAHQALGEFEEAIDIYKKYISHFGLKLSVLNSVGECYLRIGDKENALSAFEKSLEINPAQEAIRKIVSVLKER